MTLFFLLRPTSRREVLRNSATLTGGAFPQLFPASLLHAGQQAPASDPVAAMRAQMGAVPISPHKLTDNLTLLSGPGGIVVVLNQRHVSLHPSTGGTLSDMLVTVQEHIEKLKSAGKSIQEAVAAKPLADLDATWGKGHAQRRHFRPGRLPFLVTAQSRLHSCQSTLTRLSRICAWFVLPDLARSTGLSFRTARTVPTNGRRQKQYMVKIL